MSDAAVPVLCEWYVRRSGDEWSRERCGAVAAFRDPRGPRWLCWEHAERSADAEHVARERATAAMLRGLG